MPPVLLRREPMIHMHHPHDGKKWNEQVEHWEQGH